MKEEVLRMEHIDCYRDGIALMEDMHITLRRGETMGLLIKNAHRRSSVVRLLCGLLPVQNGRIYYEDHLIDLCDYEALCRRRVALVGGGAVLIDSMSVAENIFLIRAKLKTYLVNKRRLRQQSQRLLEQFGASIDPDAPISRLSPIDRMIVQLVKAHACGAHIVVLSDISRVLGEADMQSLMQCVEKLKTEGTGIFLVDAYADVLTRHSDRLSVFSSRTVIKVFRREDFDARVLSILLEDPPATPSAVISEEDREPVLALCNVSTKSLQSICLSVMGGEVVSVLDMDGSGGEEIAAMLNGECALHAGHVLLCGAPYVRRNQAHAVRRGLGIVGDNPTHSSLFRNYSVMENLSLPISSRIPTFFVRRRYMKSLQAHARAYLPEEVLRSPTLHPLREDTLQRIVYARFRIMRPRAMVLVRPLSVTDAQTSRTVREQIAAMAQAGCAVLVLSTNAAEAKLLGHRVLELSDGRIRKGE